MPEAALARYTGLTVGVGKIPCIVKQAVASSTGHHQPALAVVTVTYSPGAHLETLIESLEGATRQRAVLICADNGSTDGAPQRAAENHGNVEFLPTGGNVGYGAAINAAERTFRQYRDAGEVDPGCILIVNPDVRFTPGAIDAMVECLRSNQQAGAVGPRIQEADGSIYPSAREVPNVVTGIGHAVLSGVWPANPFSRAYRANERMDVQRTAGWLSGSCLLVRWEAFEQIGGFDERYFMYMEDIDFGDRLARAGWENIYCPSAVIEHDQGHVAKKFRTVTVPAHHASAYRFQRDRHPYWWQAPIRWALRAGLKIRGVIQLGRKVTHGNRPN